MGYKKATRGATAINMKATPSRLANGQKRSRPRRDKDAAPHFSAGEVAKRGGATVPADPNIRLIEGVTQNVAAFYRADGAMIVKYKRMKAAEALARFAREYTIYIDRRKVLVSAEHVSPRYRFAKTEVTVHRARIDGDRFGFYATHPDLGCGKTYLRGQDAIHALFGDHACTNVQFDW